ISVELQIETVHEPQRPKLILGELARESPLSLIAKLSYPVENEAVVEFIITVHGAPLGMNGRKSAASTRCLFPEILPNGGPERSNAFTYVERPNPAVAPLGVEQISPGDGIGCFRFAPARFERFGCVGFN